MDQQRRKEKLFFGVLVKIEGEAVAGGGALVAVGPLAETAAHAGGNRILAQVVDGQSVGQKLRVLRLGPQADGVGGLGPG